MRWGEVEEVVGEGGEEGSTGIGGIIDGVVRMLQGVTEEEDIEVVAGVDTNVDDRKGIWPVRFCTHRPWVAKCEQNDTIVIL